MQIEVPTCGMQDFKRLAQLIGTKLADLTTAVEELQAASRPHNPLPPSMNRARVSGEAASCYEFNDERRTGAGERFSNVSYESRICFQ